MILIVGASGRLGRAVARQLLAKGRRVRVLTRTPAKVEDLAWLGAEVVVADLRRPESLRPALLGIDRVFTAAQGDPGDGANNPRAVDDVGTRCLIHQAKATGVSHFVFTSALGARPDHPLEDLRIKHAIEACVRSNLLSYTILRPAALMEWWVEQLGAQIRERGELTIVGNGTKPIDFVAVEDVASFAVLALEDPAYRGRIVEVGGPELLTLGQVVTLIEEATGRQARRRQVPVPAARALSALVGPLNPGFGRQIAAAVNLVREEPLLDRARTGALRVTGSTRLADVVRRSVAEAALPLALGGRGTGRSWLTVAKDSVAASRRS